MLIKDIADIALNEAGLADHRLTDADNLVVLLFLAGGAAAAP